MRLGVDTLVNTMKCGCRQGRVDSVDRRERPRRGCVPPAARAEVVGACEHLNMPTMRTFERSNRRFGLIVEACAEAGQEASREIRDAGMGW